MFKRGISPLIATVLIIGFTVALGSVILVWGGDFIKGLQSGAELSEERASSCAAATMDVTNLEQTAPNKLKFLLENTGQPEIQSVILRITGDKGTASVTKPGLKPAGKKAYDASFDPNEVGVVTDLGIIPTIKTRDKTDSCVPGMELESSLPPDTAQQWDNACPNEQIEEWEECEGTDLNGQTCELLGHTGGSLACDPSYCTLDVTGCTGGPSLNCGNGAIDTGEECDYDPLALTPILPELTDCTTVGSTGGTLGCNTQTCTFDTTLCTSEQIQQPICGNNIKEEGEECDGTDPGGMSCINLRAGIGTINCNQDCTIDSSNCKRVIDIRAGLSHTCMLIENGDVYCWGRNNEGQLGIGSTSSYTVTKPVKAIITGTTQISAGDRHTCALTSSGMYCWGQNSNGQLGNGNVAYSQPTPTLVDQTIMGTPTSIYAGSSDTCAISNSKLYCWGYNYRGLFGVGNNIQQTRPTLSNLANPKSVAIGYYHACAIDTSNNVLCSGYNAHNELSQFDLVTSYSYKPAVNPAITGATGITAGYYHSCATDSTGTLTCWGWAWGGYALTTPTLPNGVSALAADAGADESCAIGSDNKLYCWGANQLGEVTGSTMMTNPSKVAVGSAHICALNTTGIYCWGSTFSTTPGLVDFSFLSVAMA